MQVTKLSDLLAGQGRCIREGCESGDAAFHVDVDVESFEPPVGLEFVSFIAKFDQTGKEFDQTMFDVAVSYGLANVEVALEVYPHRHETLPSMRYLLMAAVNASFSLVLHLPTGEEDTPAARERYMTAVKDLAESALSLSSLNRMAFPVTNYLEYLFFEYAGGNPDEFKITDPYLITLTEAANPDFVATMKDALRHKIYEMCGGEAGFRELAKGLCQAIYAKTNDFLVDWQAQVSEHMAKNPPSADVMAQLSAGNQP